jgi:hypothetical protein
MCLCLLNVHADGPTPGGAGARRRSRGLVIPPLIGARCSAEVIEGLKRESLESLAPFRLIAAEAGSAAVAEARWDGSGLMVAWHAGPPICFVSSGLGDARVRGRLDLFEEMVVARGATAARQDEFHGHAWPDRPEVSVMMRRPDARTVSVTRVEVARSGGAPRVSMAYHAVVEDETGRRPTGDADSVGACAGSIARMIRVNPAE